MANRTPEEVRLFEAARSRQLRRPSQSSTKGGNPGGGSGAKSTSSQTRNHMPGDKSGIAGLFSSIERAMGGNN